tara:strand:- start:238 stop:624 length:387 start_codon:yes stop_codon:yes gene_type:complete
MLLLVVAVVVEPLVQMHMVLLAVVLVRCLLRLNQLVHHLQHLMLFSLELAEVIAMQQLFVQAQEFSLLSRSLVERSMEMAVVEVVQTDLVLRNKEVLDLTIHLPDKVLDLVADHQQVIPRAVLVVQQH